MSDRFDGKARDVVDTFADSFEENQYAATLGEARREVAAAIRSTSEEAERRGELKGLEFAEDALVQSQHNAHPFARQGVALKKIRARIAELKKGEKL